MKAILGLLDKVDDSLKEKLDKTFELNEKIFNVRQGKAKYEEGKSELSIINEDDGFKEFMNGDLSNFKEPVFNKEEINELNTKDKSFSESVKAKVVYR